MSAYSESIDTPLIFWFSLIARANGSIKIKQRGKQKENQAFVRVRFTTKNIHLIEGYRAVCVQNVVMHLRCAGMPSGFLEYVSGELLSRGAMSTLL